MIYFLCDPTNGRVKIGCSADPSRRMNDIRKHAKVFMVPLGIIDGNFAEEKKLHERFSRFAIGGEWFRFDSLALEEIKAIIRDNPPEPKPPKTSNCMTGKEACERLKVSQYRLMILANSGAIGRRQTSAHRRYRRSDVERLASQQADARQPA